MVFSVSKGGFKINSIVTTKLEEILKSFLAGSGDQDPPTFPVVYFENKEFREVGRVKYTYSETEKNYQAEITITDNDIVEAIKNGQKWIDISTLDRPQVRDIQAEKTE